MMHVRIAYDEYFFHAKDARYPIRGRMKISQKTKSLKLSHSQGAKMNVLAIRKRNIPEIAIVFAGFGGQKRF